MTRAKRPHHDIAIAGAGPAGLIAAACLAAQGFSVLIADPAPPVTDGAAEGADWRSTAFLREGRALFEAAGLWPLLEPHATPLKALRIVDCVGDPPAPRLERAFEGAEAGEGGPFGWNLLNWIVRRELHAALGRMENVTLREGTAIDSATARLDKVILRLTDGTSAEAALLIGADGRDSTVRRLAGIGARITRFGQKSLAFAATHEIEHREISTEIYHEGGPFTMVPLADIEGRPASAIVWMNPGPEAERLRALPDAELGAEMTRRSAGLFGAMHPVSQRGIFPIVTLVAEALTARRTLLIAEAAHVYPPIGAQGLNTSMSDIARLCELLRAAPEDPGAESLLSAYEAARLPDIRARAAAIGLFNRVTRSPDAAMQALRRTGLRAAHDIAPLRDGLTRAGLSPLR